MKIKQIDEKIERAKNQIADLKSKRKHALLTENRQRKRAAKFRIGDIVKYGCGVESYFDGEWLKDHSKERPLLITQITFKSDGTPCYAGLQILEGKVSRVWGNTSYGHGETRLVGTVADLRFCHSK